MHRKITTITTANLIHHTPYAIHHAFYTIHTVSGACAHSLTLPSGMMSHTRSRLSKQPDAKYLCVCVSVCACVHSICCYKNTHMYIGVWNSIYGMCIACKCTICECGIPYLSCSG
ncbi:hypothetical protein EON63_20790 [archaeon]|nr:MAG: hypothetical protein EON63_20790 [archaeon]